MRTTILLSSLLWLAVIANAQNNLEVKIDNIKK